MKSSWPVVWAIVAACALFTAVKAYGDDVRIYEARQFCSTLQYEYPYGGNHKLLPAKCVYVRNDVRAGLVLFRVWVWDIGPKARRLYTACVYSDGNEDTVWRHVYKVGQRGGDLC